jgi:hypothetical protein
VAVPAASVLTRPRPGDVVDFPPPDREKSAAPMPSTRSSAARDPLRPLLCALLLASALVLSIADHADPDLWGHVRYGADALAAHHLPATTTYTYTAPSQPWINHEWVSEVIFAAVARVGGGTGLVALKVALGLALFAAVIGIARRRGAGLSATALTVLLAAVNLSPGWSVRPQIFSYAAFALMIILLDRRVLWPIPLLFVAWVNTHAGFVAGLVVLGLYVSCTSLAAFQRRSASAVRDAAYGAAGTMASVLAILCTPYGLAFVVTLHRPAISEWQAFAASDLQFAPFVALVVLIAVAWIGTRRPRSLAQTVILIVVVWQSYLHARHAPFLAILAALWLPPHVQSLVERWKRTSGPSGGTPGSVAVVWYAAWGLCAILLLAVMLRVRPPWVEKSAFPVDAFTYMRTNHMSGRLVAHFDWAQYALYAFAPPTTLQFDGRFETAYPDEIADMHFDFLLGEEGGRQVLGDPARVLEFARPELVLVSRRYLNPVSIMMGPQGDWVLLYQDELAQLWGLRRKYDEPASADYLPSVHRSISERPENGRVAWPAQP